MRYQIPVGVAKVSISLVCLLGALVAQTSNQVPQSPQIRPVVIFVGHKEPSKDERAIISMPAPNAKLRAGELSLEVFESATGVFVYPNTLMGLKAVDDQLAGMAALLRITRAGSLSTTMDQLSKEDRERIIDVLTIVNKHDAVGATLKFTNAQIELQGFTSITVSDGKREIPFHLTSRKSTLQPSSSLPALKPEELEEIKKKRLSDERFNVNILSLRFEFGAPDPAMKTAERVRLMSEFNEHIAKKLDAQKKAHDDLQKSLIEAIGAKDVPLVNSKGSSLPDSLKDTMISWLKVSHGFKSDEDARNFLDKATITRSAVLPMVSLFMKQNGTLTQQSIYITTLRPNP